jgi:DNA polymerase-3 subunit epsilon
VGKSIKIRERVISHFRDKSKKEIKLCQEVSKITFELTGSELIALLKESSEIKEHRPIYNRKQKRIGETYALTYFTNDNGIIELKTNYLKEVNNPIYTYQGINKAKEHLKKIIEKNNFCPKFTSLEKGSNSCFYFQIKKCKGVCCNEENKQDYNKRILQFILTTQPKKLKETIFTVGRKDIEDGFVYINKGAYMGYGYLPKSVKKRDNKTLQKHLIPKKDNRDARRIISSFLKKSNPL